MKIYIAGPMRGYARWNFDAFDEAEERWKAEGHDPFSPAQLNREMGVDPKVSAEQIDVEFAKRVIVLLYSMDAFALLPGWERSTGATVELALAQFLGLPIYDAVTMKQIDVLGCPWEFVELVPKYIGEERTDAMEI